MAAIDKVLRLPNWVKLTSMGIVMCLLFTGFYFSVYRAQLSDIQILESQLNTKRQELHKNKVIANNLLKFQRELELLKQRLKEALDQLPNEKEIPQLLKDIENLAEKVDLDVFYIKLTDEVPKGFYADVPIEVKVRGGFHNTVIFFDEISHFSRIINISKLNMGDVQVKEDGRVVLTTSCLATTFRFIQAAGAGGGGGG